MRGTHLLGFSSLLTLTPLLALSQTFNRQHYDSLARNIVRESLVSNKAYEMLFDLCTSIGPRLSGSPNASKAVEWSKKKMEEFGFDRVWLAHGMVTQRVL